MLTKYVVSTFLLLIYPFSSFCLDGHNCIPNSVSANYDANLMVIGCSNGSLNQGYDGRYFAYPMGGSFFQAFLSIANAAVSTGRMLYIVYDPAQLIGTSYDCITFGKCRLIVSLRQTVWSMCQNDDDCPDKKVCHKNQTTVGTCLYPYSICEKSVLITFARIKKTESCVPYQCTGSGCLRNCYKDSDCAGGFTCDENTKNCARP